ncbi:MAG TPA: SPFH domain-containing protein, partial [Candidatus Thermoplasmatota archaeon]|nr:SPFH domain-containing protein [Candidatus Thermoplasmatota archaeon]
MDAPRSLPNASTLRATVERSRGTIPGFIGLIILVLVVGAAIGVLGLGVVGGNPILIGVGLVMGVLGLLTFNGMFILEPNEAAVLTLFGTYKGTVKSTGWHLVNPLIKKRQLSVRANNFNSDKLKVNDADGNPVEIAAVVVWRVFDTARATFDVENYKQFVQV